MKINSTLWLVLFSMLLANVETTYSTSLGSNTEVNNQDFFVFPTDQQNQIFGMYYMQGGFALQDSNTTCTFDARFPIRGSLALNGGTLYLTTDLKCDNILTFTSVGNITALGNYSITLPDKFSFIGISTDSNIYTFQNIALNLNSDVTLYSALQFTGTLCQIDGRGNALDLSSTGSLIVDSNSVLQLRNVTLKNVHGSNVRLLNDNAILGLQNVNILQDATVNFTKGAIVFDGDVNFIGTSTFNYSSAQTSTIKSNSHIIVNDGFTLNIGRASASTLIEPLYFTDASSVLHFDNSYFMVNPNGMNLTNGILTLERQSIFNILSTSTANGLSLGNGNAARNMLLKNYPAATITLLAGHFLYNDTITNAINSGAPATRIIRGNTSTLHIAQNATLSDVEVDAFQAGAHISFDTEKTFRVNNVQLKVPGCTMVLNCFQTGDSSIALQGNDSLDVVDGSMPLLVSVSGSGNKLTGSGDITGIISLMNNQSSLISSLQGTVFNSIAMNGGSITLGSSLNLGNSVALTGSGTVDLSSKNIIFGGTDLIWSGTTTWKGSGSSINLSSDIWLDGIWTLTGVCTINGNGHTLDLRNTGQIVVNPQTTITIKDVTIKNIKNTNIICVDNTAKIILSNVDWQQSESYQFTQGSLVLDDTVVMIGNTIFAYQSAQTSTVNNNTEWTLDSGFTFSYDPIFVDSSSLINFIDKTSELILNGATLHATVTGITLTRGSLIVTDNSVISSEIQTNEFADILYNKGIVFGADDANSDFVINISGGYVLRLAQGLIAYRNINEGSFIAANLNSTLFIDGANELDLWQTLNLGTGVVKFGDGASLGIAPGRALIGTVIPLGSLNQFDL